VAAQLAYPFNRFRRVEFSVDLQTVTDEVAEVLFVNGEALVAPGTRSNFFYAIPEVALVHDNAAYSGFTPVTGGRWRAAVSQAVGDIDFTFGVADWRRYLNIRTRSALALRLLGAGSTGQDTQILRIGGPDTFRGADYGQLVGTRVAVGNVELRFPIIPSTELIRGVVFVDAAMAWDTSFSPKPAVSGGPLGVTLRDLALAYGVGVRGFIGLPLRFDAAIPTDLARNFDWRTSFSIGLDF
jgi:outer membrane protein assembly factor BamA